MRFLYPNGKRKALTLSYDDGQVFDRRLIDIFNEYNLKGTFHLNSSRSLQTFDKKELVALYSGHEVASHGVYHKFLTELNQAGATLEVMNDKKTLESVFKTPVRGMSYAFGVYNEDVKRTLKGCGINYCRTVNATHDFWAPADFLEWHPTCHHDDNLMELTERFLNGVIFNDVPVFYVWGHSFEFDRNNNWNHIEEFAKKVSGKEDIWYATNIQIYDYIQAVRSIEYWAGGEGLYNPSAQTIWVEEKGKVYTIKPLQKIIIK